jgi:signal transduction histidine kinase
MKQHDAWFVAPGGRGEVPQTNLIYLSIIMAGGFLALSLMYVMLFFMLNMQRVNLFFALFCLVWAARLWVTASGQLSPGTGTFFGLSWYAEFRIEYISIPVAAALMVAIINSLFPGILHRLFRYIIYAASAAIVVRFAFAQPTFMTMTLLEPIMWFYGLAVVYIIVRFVWKLRRINLSQGIFLSGCGVFLYFILAEFLGRLDMFSLPLYTGWGVANFIAPAFILCMGAAVFLAARAEVDAAKEAEHRLTTQMETISHEAQGPLGALSNFARFVALEIKEKGPTEQTAAVLHRIEHEANRVAKLIDTLSEAAPQTKDGDIKINFDIGELIKQAAAIYRPIFEAKGVKLDIQAADGLMVFGNPDEINRVLSNLLSNADNHTAQGHVVITAEHQNGQMVVVAIKDTGGGIDAEHLPDVFGRGESATPGGRGIGLFVCKQIIAAHGGEILIESGVGEGTAVKFTLPAERGKEG